MHHYTYFSGNVQRVESLFAGKIVLNTLQKAKKVYKGHAKNKTIENRCGRVYDNTPPLYESGVFSVRCTSVT
jgi:hypothetical protein